MPPVTNIMTEGGSTCLVFGLNLSTSVTKGTHMICKSSCDFILCRRRAGLTSSSPQLASNTQFCSFATRNDECESYIMSLCYGFCSTCNSHARAELLHVRQSFDRARKRPDAWHIYATNCKRENITRGFAYMRGGERREADFCWHRSTRMALSHELKANSITPQTLRLSRLEKDSFRREKIQIWSIHQNNFRGEDHLPQFPQYCFSRDDQSGTNTCHVSLLGYTQCKLTEILIQQM